jgi:hypothetical protein
VLDDHLQCRLFVRQAESWLDDAVEPSEREALELHLLVCPPCEDYLVKAGRVRQALVQAPAAAPPTALLQAARERP